VIQQPGNKSLYNHEIDLGMHTIRMACVVAVCTVVTGFGFHQLNKHYSSDSSNAFSGFCSVKINVRLLPYQNLERLMSHVGCEISITNHSPFSFPARTKTIDAGLVRISFEESRGNVLTVDH
jgi:hypothetical protein